ncbi:ribonuclease H-like domain-containing protein [Tanacetum coccineum]
MSLHGYSDGKYDAVGDDDNVTLISKLDVSHPLHLHPNDYVALTIVSVKLKRTENYQVWSCAMLLALEGKNKTGFIDGSCRRAKHVWDELKETYDKVDSSVTFSLHHKIHTLSQIGSSIADYYHKLNALWKQFDALIKLPRCTCHAADDFKKHNQLMKLMQFLMGLDDTYMQIRSSILLRETLPDVRSAYAIISSEVSHRIATGSVSGTYQRSHTSAFNVNAPNRGNFQSSMHSKLVSKGLISDSGANQHITYTDKNLTNVIDVSYLKIKVTHPNGTEAFITKIGNMPLTNYLTLYDVLVSLMSVQKVARDSKLVIAFDEMHFYVMNQDLREGKILGIGKQIEIDGLYYFDGNQGIKFENFLSNNVCFLSKQTWHCRLGHPADKVLDVLKSTLNFDNKTNDLICDTCQRAKQIREPFPLSDHVSTELGLSGSDNGTEFVNQQFSGFYELNGIIHQTSCSYTLNKMGLLRGSMDTFLILPTFMLNGKSPYDLVYNKPHSLKHLRSFGCLAYATVLNSPDKFSCRFEKCVLVGYSNFKKGYKLWSLDNKQIVYSRDVNNTLDDLPELPNDEERRNPSPIRHGNSPPHSGSTSASSKENDVGQVRMGVLQSMRSIIVILRITILTTNTPYPSRKIRRIRAYTHQRPQRKEDQYAVSREDQYAVLDIWHVNILEDIKHGPYSKKP